MDPALHEIIASAAPGELVEAVVLLKSGHELPPPARAVARFGNVVTCRVPVEGLVALRNDVVVDSLKASRIVAAPGDVPDDDLDYVEGEGDTRPRRPAAIAERGARAVVCVLDWGCDFAHPNFRRADGSTRLLALWDQRRPAVSDNRYGYGTIWSAADIDRALRERDPYAALGYHPAEAEQSATLGSHGTHVMDTAAGSGNPSGIAPDASLVFIHLSSRGASPLGNLGDSVRVLEAVDFARATAGDRPWVCNLSLGRTGGEKTGRSLVERALDAVVEESPGRAIVHSCGNYFAKRLHSEGWLHAGASTTLDWIVAPDDSTPNELEIWYSGRDRLDVELTSPARTHVAVAPDSVADIAVNRRTVGRLYHRTHDPVNGDNHVDCFLAPGAPGGRWTVTLRARDVADGRWHAWIERDSPVPGRQSSFGDKQASTRCTINTIASSYRGITTGAVTAANEPAAFSSSGPTRDGRVKPDLTAPGDGIVAARSTRHGDAPGTSGHARMRGTSCASPQVAGTVALMFDAAPRPLAIGETRTLLLRSCAPLAGSDPLRVGAGLLDTLQAVGAARAVAGATSAKEDSMESYFARTQTNGSGHTSGVAAILDRGWMADEEDEALAEVLEGSESSALSPDALYRDLAGGMGPPLLEIVAYPGQRLTGPLSPGDVLLRVAPGEPGLGHVAVLTDGALAPVHGLAARGLAAESGLPGVYSQVIEGGAFPHAATDGFARRVADRFGYVPPGQMILRVPSRVDAIEAEWSDDAEATPQEEAASSAMGRQLELRASSGIAVAIYATDHTEFANQAVIWAKREDALGLRATAIASHELRFGKAIADTGDLPKLLTDLKNAMDEALIAVVAMDQIASGAPVWRGVTPAPKIRALALFSHGWQTSAGVSAMGVCGNIDTTTVTPLVNSIADHLADNVTVILFGCTIALGKGEAADPRTTTMEPGGKDSLCGLFRDALVDKKKTRATVWGHTEIAHTTTNPALRRFAVADGKQADGVPFAGGVVFSAANRTKTQSDLEASIVAQGFELPSPRTTFDTALATSARNHLYDAYIAAIFTNARDNKDNIRLLGDNLAEMAPLYSEEVATIIRDYWAKTYWTAPRIKDFAKKLATAQRLKKKPATPAPVRTPVRVPTSPPRRTPQPTP